MIIIFGEAPLSKWKLIRDITLYQIDTYAEAL